MKLRSALAAVALAATTALVATPAQAAPIGQGFTVTAADLAYILRQIKIAEAHVAGTTSATGPCGALLDLIGSPMLARGLRTVDGSCNHLTQGQESYGAGDQLFPRLGGRNFTAAENAPAGLFGPGSPRFATTYADKSANNTVVDSQPRMISNLIADQTAANPAAVAAAGFPVRSQGAAGVDAATVPAGQTLFIPNVTTDIGLSAPYNSWFTLFGQFFDHGIDQTVKGGGTVVVPLRADDPLIAGPDRTPGTADDPRPGDARYVKPSMRFMALTRAANQPGPDGRLGTADDIQDAKNTDTPYVDLSQVYTSHAAHQVFLREYALDAGRPQATGLMLAGASGGLPTWAEVKAQAAAVLGLALTDADVLDVPQILADPYGAFVPGPARGLPQYVTRTGLVEGDLAAPVAVPAGVLHFDTPFLTDLAHHADPSPADTDHNPATPPVAPRPDADHTASADFASQAPGTYDDEMLDAHYIAGDGRVNENIGLTAVHQIFHAEHNRLVGDIQRVLAEDDPAALPEWTGDRLFQGARFIDEMEYQHLVFEEFARKIQPAINPFQPFAFTQTEIDPAVTAEFAHAVYRFGHSMLTETIARTRDDGTDDSLSLLDGFLNPPAYTDNGTLSPEQAAGAVVTGMSDQVGNELDEFMTNTLRDNLLGLPMDLAAINLARGRSEGLPSLNTFRRGQGLTPYSSWVDLGENLKHPESLVNFVAAYGRHPGIVAATTTNAKREAARRLVDPQPGEVPPADAADFLNATGAWTTATSGLDDVDLWIGGLAEVTDPFGGLLGSTFNHVFERQMTDLQNGDRLYYLARTPGMNLRTQLEGNSFAELIGRTTGAHTLKADAFATADCKFELSHLDGTAAGYRRSGGRVADDPATTCDETALLLRKPDGTIQYRARNGVDRPGVNGQSVYNGTDDADRVRAGNDNDTVWGNEGDDVLEGGAGNDVALGGEGDDIITDLGGDDVPKGGPGNDAIDAGPGLDIVLAGTGKDFTTGGANTNETFAGEGDDAVLAGDGEDTVFGDAGDDWEEGGNGADLLQGDSGNLFFLDDTNRPGNDVLIGQGGDDDYDMEGGDDIGVQGPGIEKNAGGSGYDWSIAASDSDLALPLTPLGILPIGVRDRYNEVEALSGTAGDDVLRGDDVVPSTVGGGGFLGCDALDAAGVARIHGLDEVVTALPTPVSAVGDATGRPCDLRGTVWGEGNILLGGPGDDTLQGRGGDDILDGDRYLDVRLSVRDADGREIRGARTMAELQADVFAGTINPKDVFTVREILSAAEPDVDTAVFSGPRAAYAVTPIAGGVLVSGPDGTDTVRNVERLAFADETVTVAGPAFTGVTAFAGDGRATVLITVPAGAAGVTGLMLEQVAGGVTRMIPVAAGTTSFVATGLTNGVPVTFRLRVDTAAGPGTFTAASTPVTPAATPTDDGPANPGDDDGTQPDDEAPAVPTHTTPAPTTPTPAATTPGVPAATTPAVPVATTPAVPVATTPAVPVATTPAVPVATTPAVPVATTPAVPVATTPAVPVATTPAVPAATTPIVPGPTTSVVPAPTTPTVPTSTDGAVPGSTTPAAPITPPTSPAPTSSVPSAPTTSGPATPVAPVVPVAPGAPVIGAATAGDGSAVVRWTAPGSDGGSPIYGYEVQALDDETGIAVDVDVAAPDATELTFHYLTNDVAYSFWVRAVNAAGAGEFSAISNRVVPAATTPPPSGPSATGPTPADPTTPAARTTTTPDPAPTTQTPTIPAPTTPVPTTQPTSSPVPTTQPTSGPTTPTPTTPSPAGPTTPGGNGTVTPRTAPGAPHIGSVSPGDRLVVVRWTAPAGNGGSPIRGYEVQAVDARTGRTVATRSFAGTAFTATVTGLANGTTYRFAVRAWNAIGTGAFSPASARVTPRSAPGAVGKLTAAPGGRGGAVTASVTWAAPAGTNGAAITAYRITWQQLTGHSRPTGAATVTSTGPSRRTASFTAPSGIAAGTAYRVTVQAVNAAGAGSARAVTTTVR